MNPSRTVSSVLLHAVVVLGAAMSVFPFYWLFVMATSRSADIFAYPPKLVWGSLLLTNIRTMLSTISFFTALGNSITVSTVHTALVLFFCSLAGFAFAKFAFPGKTVLFVFLLATMMVPNQLGLVPMYIIMQKIGWIDNLKAIVIPGVANAFGIFWMRQYMTSAIHDELLEASRIDGCTLFGQYWRIAFPILKPALATLGIITFLGSWNDYLWPLIIINSEEHYTLQLAIASLFGARTSDYGMIMAGTLLATLPLLIMFALFSRQFIAGLTDGAVKH